MICHERDKSCLDVMCQLTFGPERLFFRCVCFLYRVCNFFMCTMLCPDVNKRAFDTQHRNMYINLLQYYNMFMAEII